MDRNKKFIRSMTKEESMEIRIFIACERAPEV